RASTRRPGARPKSGTTTRPASGTTARPAVSVAGGRRSAPPHVWRLGILAVLVGFLALFLTPTLRGYLEQRAEINRMEQQITQEQDAIVELEEQVAAWDDEDYVEQQARQRLRFVKPGETAFTVVDDTGEQLTEPVPGMASVTDEVHESRPWYGEVWESVMTANEGVPEDDGVPQP
ncbi:MAG: septum formation initiator family protein, partial [Actinomycetota bacterium]|nr:septum formation initiator family protein [Actinomycetota bacterium]